MDRADDRALTPAAPRPYRVALNSERSSAALAPWRGARLLATLALGLIFVNIGLFVLGPMTSVRVVATDLALQVGLVYGLLSGAIVGIVVYLLFPRSRSNTGLSLLVCVIVGVAGFFAVAHSLAFYFTNRFGTPGFRLLTVSDSYWIGARGIRRGFRRADCFEHDFVNVSRIAKAGTILCIDRALKPGAQVRLTGHVSDLGVTVTQVSF